MTRSLSRYFDNGGKEAVKAGLTVIAVELIRPLLPQTSLRIEGLSSINVFMIILSLISIFTVRYLHYKVMILTLTLEVTFTCLIAYTHIFFDTLDMFLLTFDAASLILVCFVLFNLSVSEEIKTYEVDNSLSEIELLSDRENRPSFQSEYSVELVNLNKVYDTGYVKVHALKDINLKIRRGEFVAIMGPSGSGKSTLLNLLGALDRPTSGKVLIDGVDISKLSNDELARLRNEKIGFVFQSYNLINRSKIIRNVELPALIKGIPKKERVKRALQLLEVLGLSNVQNRTPKTLSGGQQQRVAIARALINNPAIILADEPTGNLDSVSGREVIGHLRRMNEKFGTTIILVTHDREMAEMADRIVYLKDGRIIGEEVIRRSKNEKE